MDLFRIPQMYNGIHGGRWCFPSLGRSVGRREGSVLYADAVIRKRRYSSAPFKNLIQNRNAGDKNDFLL